MTTQTIDILEVPSRFSELLSSVETGTEIILTRDNTPVARLVPLETSPPHRIPGLHPGAMEMSDDFIDPLPDSFWEGDEAFFENDK